MQGKHLLTLILLACAARVDGSGSTTTTRFVITFQDGNALEQYSARTENASEPLLLANATIDKWYGRRIIIRFGDDESASAFWGAVQQPGGAELLLGSNVKWIEEDFETAAEQDQTPSVLSGDDLSLAALNLKQWSMDPNEAYGMLSWINNDVKNNPVQIASGIVVAALDSGLSPTVLDAFNSIEDGYDFVSDPSMSRDGDGRDADWTDPGDWDPSIPSCGAKSSWHGTMTGSLLAARPQVDGETGNIAFSGVVPNATIMPVRVLGACKTGYASDVADAIVWAAGGYIRGMENSTKPRQPTQVILMPFSGYSGYENGGATLRRGCPSYLQSAVDLAVARNITLVASAGNNYNASVLDYFPANCRGVYSVGALNRMGRYAAYSNQGASMYMPGGDSQDQLLCMSDGKVLVPCMGTSFAAAHAAAWVAAIIGMRGYFEVPRAPGVYNSTYSSDAQSWDGTNATVTGATDVCSGFVNTYFLTKAGTGGSTQNCPANACRWGFRYGNLPSNWINFIAYNTGGVGLDEFCICTSGYYANTLAFVYTNCNGYGNADARPSGLCYTCPAAYDFFQCSACPSGYYCPGSAGYQDHCTSCGNSDCYYLEHYGYYTCTTCSAGAYWSSGDCRTTDRSCAACPAGTYSNTNNAASCTAWGVCPGGWFVAVTPSASADRVCAVCGPGGYSNTVNQASCTGCSKGYYQSSSVQTSCLECATGTYADATYSTVCKKCPTGYFQPRTGQSMCEECGPGGYSGAEGASGCTPCSPGTYQNSNKQASCVPCSIDTYASGQYATACTPCSNYGAGYFSGTGWSYCTQCNIAGSYWDRTTLACTQCPTGKYQGTGGLTYCSSCPAGTVATTTGLSACSTCGLGRYAVTAAQCADCASGTYWNSSTAGTTACTECGAESYAPGTDATPTFKATSCMLCNANQVSFAKSSSCITCQGGTYANKLTHTCDRCAAGQYSSFPDTTACSDCPAGTYAPVVWTSSCTRCSPGTYSTGGQSVCTQCAAGTWSITTGATSAETCFKCTGYYIAPVPGSVICPSRCADDIPVATSAHTSCGTQCPLGEVPRWTVLAYTDGTQDVGCISCQNISSTQFESSWSQGTCTPCKSCTATQYKAANCTDKADTSCTECPVCVLGTSYYSANCTATTPSSCLACRAACTAGYEYETRPCTLYQNRDCADCSTLCPANQYMTAACSAYQDIQCTACTNCSAGSYVSVPCNTSSNRECLPCPAGSYSSAQNSGSCTQCQAGKYAPDAGATTCLPCSVGTYVSSAGAAVCLACGEGKYSVVSGVSSCTTCPVGTYLANATTGNCSWCPGGTYSTVDGVTACKTCAAGSFSLSSVNTTACTLCQAGYYASAAKSTNCSACTTGKYANATGMSMCADCPSGTYAGTSNASACSACPAGTYMPSSGASACIACPAGTRSNRTSGSTMCNTCADGTYANSTGWSSCLACAAACVLGKTYVEVNCTASTNRVCSPCRRKQCPTDQTSNVSWCFEDGYFGCTACPAYGNDYVHLMPEYSCLTCTSRGCGETPGTYRASTCPSRASPPYMLNETYSCGR